MSKALFNKEQLNGLGSTAPGKGAALVGFKQAGTGAVSRNVQDKLREFVSVLDFGADPTGVSDSTSAIQAALTASGRVYLPEGVYRVNAVSGIVLRTGNHIVGAGKNKTILVADAGGGSGGELVSYTRGSIIKRAFTPGVANAYVNECYLADFAVVMTHPLASVTTTAIQIGIDLRNITRSIVERVHVGNIPPIGGPVAQRAFSGNHMVQGYGIVLGNVSSGDIAYCGGEVNTLRDCSVWGAYKLIVIDDANLSPSSAALASTVDNCDLQAGHHVLVQESQFCTGVSIRDNVLQDVRKQPGDVSNGYLLRIEGYNNEATGGYYESGSGANFLVYLGASSRNNLVRMAHYTATNAATITDAGSRNRIQYFENTGSIAGGVDDKGRPLEQYDQLMTRRPERGWVKFNWNGSAIVISGSDNVQSVTRTSAGDYLITWSRPFPSANYALSVVLDTNASGHGGTVSVFSHSASNTRIVTYGQNAGTSTLIDPQNVWVTATL